MGIAYLPDGSNMDYDEYIRSHPHWQAVRKARYDFDGGKCAVCHKQLASNEFETHHLSYMHLGNERIRDVLTLCSSCHTIFHNNWRKQEYWKGRESGHWDAFSLEHTAKLCAMYYKQDKYICKDPEGLNLCNKDVQRQMIDKYFADTSLSIPALIDPNDIGLFVRNKRYEMFFEAESRGLTVEQFLDECYGEKVRGKNPMRQEAGKKGGTFDHTPMSFHRHYKENKNINILMQEVKKYE